MSVRNISHKIILQKVHIKLLTLPFHAPLLPKTKLNNSDECMLQIETIYKI